MNLGQIYDLTKFKVNQDQLGDMPRPSDFNVLLVSASLKLYTDEYQFLLRLHNEKGFPLSDLIEQSDTLRRFIRTQTGQGLTNGYVTLANDFKYPVSAEVNLSSVGPSGGLRHCDILGDKKFSMRKSNVFAEPAESRPFGNIAESRFYVVPDDADFVNYKYLRLVVDPVFDCCFTSGLDLVYMPVGSQLVQNGGQVDLQDDGGTLIEADVTHYLESTTIPYTSNSVELDWDTTEHNKIVDLLVTAIATRNREMNIVQMNEQLRANRQ